MNKRGAILVVMVLVLTVLSALQLLTTEAQAVQCTSCANCSASLNQTGSVATMFSTITTGFGDISCVTINASNTVLDCNGSTISNGASSFVGVNVTGFFNPGYNVISNITIKNCITINSFTRSISVDAGVTNVTIDNNTLVHSAGANSGDLVFLDTSNFSNVYNNTFQGLTAISFRTGGYNGIIIDNNTFARTGTGGVTTAINLGPSSAQTTGINITHNSFAMSNGGFNLLTIVVNQVGPNVLIFKNNFLNGSINLSQPNSPEFNLSNIGNHHWNYNETNDINGSCNGNLQKRDGENAPICDFPFNVSGSFANDSFPRIDIFLTPKEFWAPNLTVTFPTNLTNTTSSNVTLNVSVQDNVAISNCWYTLNNSGTNVSFTCLGNSSFIRNEGIQNITVYVNDTSNNVNESDLILFIADFTAPNATVDDPVNNSFHQNLNRSLNFSDVTDALTGIDRCFYNLNSASSNVTVSCFENTSFNADRSNNTFIFYVNDTAGNVNMTSITFHVADTLAPNLTILSIANNSNLTSTNVTLDIHVADNLGLDRCWYQLNNTGVNVSFTCLANTSFLQSNSNSSNITVYANDTAGNLNITDITIFRIDTLFPSLVVNDPLNNSQYNTSNRISLNVTISDSGTGINNCYFSVAHASNTTFDCLNQNTTFLSDEGLLNLTVFSNDSAGNVNYSNIVVYNMTDILAPRLTLVYPQNITNTTATTNISLNFTATDGQATDRCWYSLNSTGINITIPCNQNNSFSLLTNALHNITLYSNDTVGNLNQTPITLFTVDNVAPSLRVVIPENNSFLNLKNTTSIITLFSGFREINFSLNISASDTNLNLDKCWYQRNNTAENNSFDCNQNITFTATETNLAASVNGTVNFTVYANDTAGNLNVSDLVVLRVDITAPSVTISAPSNNTGSSNTNVSFNFTSGDGSTGSGVNECWYNLNDSNTNVTVTSLGCSSVVTSFIAGISNANIVIAYANDTAGNDGNKSSIFTVDNIAPSLIIDAPINGSREVTGTQNDTLGFNNYRLITLGFTALDTGGSGMNQCDYQVYTFTNVGEELFSNNRGGTITSCGNLTNSTTVSLQINQFYKIHFNNVTDNVGNNNVTSFNTTFKVVASISSGTTATTTTTTNTDGGFFNIGGGGGGGPSETPLQKVQRFFTDAPFTQGPSEGPDFISRSSFAGAQGPAMGYMGPGMFFSVAQAMAAYMTPQQQEMLKDALARGEVATVPTQDLIVTLPEKVSIPVAVLSNPVVASAVTGERVGGGVKVNIDERAALKLNYVEDEGFNVPKIDLDLQMIDYGFKEKPVSKENIENVDLEVGCSKENPNCTKGIIGITGAVVADNITGGTPNLILFIALIFCVGALVVLILLKRN